MVEKNASFILESALDRIDGILAGNRLDIPWADSSPSRLNLTEAVYRFASTLKEAKESGEFHEVHIPNHEKSLILQFLNCSDQCSGNTHSNKHLESLLERV
ncbi:uncharacterized protein LOC136037683 [Artemia franciscana]|uniref:uncharacterized protein LOC136037683 n=1 Tax=Artemia franciscana TaxID=6661 RepID=UPI0032DA3267